MARTLSTLPSSNESTRPARSRLFPEHRGRSPRPGPLAGLSRAAWVMVAATCMTCGQNQAQDPPRPDPRRSQTAPVESLFDGKTLNGWSNPFNRGTVWVEDGAIHLRGTPIFYLVTERVFGDFILELEVNIPEGGNSGVQFRSHFNSKDLWGYQAEVDTSDRRWAGGLYDQSRRGWIHPLTNQPKAQAAFKNGGWNHYRIEAFGDHIVIYVNGVPTTDYRDSTDIEGHIALQHHGEADKTYRFRNIRIQDFGGHQWVPLTEKNSLAGWHTRPGGVWTNEDGVITGTAPQSESRHGMLISDQVYDDFTVRFQFRAVEGNSGFYFRVDEVDKPAAVAGFQAEIDPSFATGGLYETYGRAWVAQSKPDEMAKHYKPGEWTDMTVSAHQRRIVVQVNGFQTAELKNDPGRLKGHLALQLHGGQNMHVQFRNLEILESSNHAPNSR